MSYNEAVVQKKGIYWYKKWTQNNYRTSYVFLFGSEEAAEEELRRNSDEL